ncbi:MAG: SRPBCC domain-containing protein [Actinomycetota bacterium]
MLVNRTIVLPAGLGSVWSALTDDRRLSLWFGAEVAIEGGRFLRGGSRAAFTWSDGRRRAAVVEALESQRLLVLRWLPFEQDAEGVTRPRDPSTIRFVLEPHLDGTRLRVTEDAPEHLDPRAELLAGTSAR